MCIFLDLWATLLLCVYGIYYTKFLILHDASKCNHKKNKQMVSFGVKKGFLYRTAQDKLLWGCFVGTGILFFLTLHIIQDIWILPAIASRNLNLLVLLI